ncbi:hypothetical protein [Dactylosporangium sp. NPDC051484]|uniref:hypothetical protein n=1 Tax=Dactylosporangium sp. NPDC051484 TaxID=3154942 RepID=UPI00344DC785
MATRRVVGFAVAYAVVVLAAAVFTDTLRNRPQTLHATAVTIAGLFIGLIGLATVLGIVITVVYWIWVAIRQTREHGAPAYGHLGFWGVGAFLVLFVLGYVVPAGVYVTAAERVLASALLIAGVLHTRAWLRRRSDPGRPYAADRYSLVTGGDAASPLAAQPTAEDWNASLWDPDVLADIERRRNRDR